MSEWRKVIPQSRDRLQANVLVCSVSAILMLNTIYFGISYFLSINRYIEHFGLNRDTFLPHAIWRFLTSVFVSLTFGLLVWRTKAATVGGILCGMLICYSVIRTVPFAELPQSALVPIIALFLLTFGATKAGRKRKALLGIAEDRRGRNAAQVIANLGMAGLVVAVPWESFLYTCLGPPPSLTPPWLEPALWAGTSMFLAALCEATADTVSSEIGQAFGGTPILLTTLRRVPPGTDGAVTLLGTVAGILAATLVALTGIWPMSLRRSDVLRALAGGIAGLFFDSLLGATLERKGWLGNDLVNFASTAFAVLVTLLLWLALR